MTNDTRSNNDTGSINGRCGANHAVEQPVLDTPTRVASEPRARDLSESKVTTVCIAGKNNIAVNGLNFLMSLYSNKIDLCFLPNPTDDGVNGWQLSFKKFGEEKKIRRASLEELYETEDLIFISLEYSEIIDPKKFRTDRLFNIHFSLLPKYKGMYTSALPIINGEEESGVTLHKIDTGIDTGDIIDQIRFQISEDDTARDLYENYLENGFFLLERNIDKLLDKTFSSAAQPINGASYYSKKSIDYKAVKISFFKTAFEVRNQFRAFTFREYQLPKFEDWEIINTKILSERSINKPGSVVRENEESIVVSTIDYNIKLFKDYYEKFWSNCTSGELKEIEKILHRIPDINLKNKMSWNAIIIATYNGHLNLLKFLVGAGAKLASTNKNGTTLLMYALSYYERSNDKSVFEYLCSHGASWEKLDTKGKSVTDYIIEKKLDDLLKLKMA